MLSTPENGGLFLWKAVGVGKFFWGLCKHADVKEDVFFVVAMLSWWQ